MVLSGMCPVLSGMCPVLSGMCPVMLSDHVQKECPEHIGRGPLYRDTEHKQKVMRGARAALRPTSPSLHATAVQQCAVRGAQAPPPAPRSNLPQASLTLRRPMQSTASASPTTSEIDPKRWPSMTLRRPRLAASGRSKKIHPKVRCNSRIASSPHPIPVASYTHESC
jgi:hypothetical protein